MDQQWFPADSAPSLGGKRALARDPDLLQMPPVTHLALGLKMRRDLTPLVRIGHSLICLTHTALRIDRFEIVACSLSEQVLVFSYIE